MPDPEVRFPFPDAAAEELFRDWQRDYEAEAQRFSTCRFVESHGSVKPHGELAALVQLHDNLTGAHGKLPLA
jgi:hypothetical protein